MSGPSAFAATLACGCRLGFVESAEGSPAVIVVQHKSASCARSLHVAGMAIHDHRSALRPPTRLGPPLQPDYEDG